MKLKRIFQVVVLGVAMVSAGTAWADFNFTGPKFVGKAASFSNRGIVSCNHPLAAQAGIDILKKGGNAFDAAIATALTLNAVDMSMCGPGGASFWLLYDAKTQKLHALDADTQAPAAATPDKFAGRHELLDGVKAMGIPGSMMAYWEVLKKFGTMSFEEVMASAVDYLENGYVLSERQSDYYKTQAAQAPIMYPNLARVFAPTGNWPNAGAIMKNPELAATYKAVAKEGIDVFYKGRIAKEMVDYVQKHDGLWTMKDLADYKVIWREPLSMKYKDLVVYGAPIPSSAVTWMEMMKIAEGYDWSKIKDGSLEYLHLMVEIVRLAHADSYQYVGDPNFIKDVSKQLLSDEYTAAQRKRINLMEAAPGRVQPGDPTKVKVSEYTPPANLPSIEVSMAESLDNMAYRGNTNHVVIIDKDGNCVSFTHTLGQFFGGQDILGNTGVIGNNGMDWFDLDKNPWTEKASALVVAPNKRNRWTLSPGMIFKDGKPYILVGGSGAESTMGGIFQALMHMLEYNLNPQASIESPRFLYGDMYHYSAGTRLYIEPELRDIHHDAMVKMGHDSVPAADIWRMSCGNVWAIMIDQKDKVACGGSEIRGDGHVAIY